MERCLVPSEWHGLWCDVTYEFWGERTDTGGMWTLRRFQLIIKTLKSAHGEFLIFFPNFAERSIGWLFFLVYNEEGEDCCKHEKTKGSLLPEQQWSDFQPTRFTASLRKWSCLPHINHTCPSIVSFTRLFVARFIIHYPGVCVLWEGSVGGKHCYGCDNNI